MRYRHILISGILASFIVLLARDWTVLSHDQLAMPEVTIKGEAKDRVKLSKLPLAVEIDLEALVSSFSGLMETLIRQTVPVPGKADFDRLKRIHSTQIAQPYLPDIPQPPLITFYPRLSDVGIREWKLSVNDEGGNAVMEISGKGSPTKPILWDGKDRKNEMIRVGKLYSYQFVALDRDEKPHTTEGVTFSLDSLMYRDGKYINIEVNNAFLFKSDSAEFRDEAIPVFRKVEDILREYSQHTFTVSTAKDLTDSALVKDREALIKSTLSANLLQLPKDIKTRVVDRDPRGSITAFRIKVR